MSIHMNSMELEITLKCNLLCDSCDRHCNFVDLPYFKDSDMTLEQIDKFKKEVVEKDVHLGRLRVLGGEPCIHPNVREILISLHDLTKSGNVGRVELITNGISDHEKIPKSIPEEIAKATKVRKSPPKKKEEKHRCNLLAPVDLGLPAKPCIALTRCGIILNAWGYWPCGSGGSVARLMGDWGYVRYEFPSDVHETWPTLTTLCGYCYQGNRGHMPFENETDNIPTRSLWKGMTKWLKGRRFKQRRY